MTNVYTLLSEKELTVLAIIEKSGRLFIFLSGTRRVREHSKALSQLVSCLFVLRHVVFALKRDIIPLQCKMSLLFLILLLPALASSQSLVLVGGGLTDENAPVWDKVVELAVSTQSRSIKYAFYTPIIIFAGWQRSSSNWYFYNCLI